MSLEKLRAEIDSIDEKLIRLLGERAACALQVGEEKRRRGVPLVDPGREREVQKRVRRLNSGPLSPEQMESIYERIISECARLQEQTRAQGEAQ
jgi:chorismate mutase